MPLESPSRRGTASGSFSELLAGAAERRGLRRRDDVREPGWTFWELRNLNMHRVVGLLRQPGVEQEPQALVAAVREALERNFHRSWWRGIAYGVAVERESAVPPPADLVGLVDVRENRHGVLQWVVVAAPGRREATAVHTWEEVFLSPVYRAVLDGLRADGWPIATAVRQKDGLMRVLTGISAVEGVTLPEFREDDPEPSPPDGGSTG